MKHPYICRRRMFPLIGAVTFLILVTASPARCQWTQPSGSSTVYKTDTNGNVGIGTIPDTNAKLHVYNPPSAGVDIQSADTAGWSRLRLVTRTHTYGWFAGDSAQADAPNKVGLYDYTVGAWRMMIDSSGNVGIGTTNPTRLVSLNAASAPYISFNEGGTEKAVIGTEATGYSRRFIIYDSTAGQYRFVIDNSGRVGVGTQAPSEALDVVGNVKASGTIFAKYQDVAEWVPSSEKLTAATVVVLDQTRPNQVVASRTAYDTRVAGVISAQPGITLGEKSEEKVLVATTGRVRVRVDATKAPINIGDLLVTSDIPGVAMKSEAVNLGGVQIHRPGTIIGKALEPLAKGKGEILVLLSLQ